MDPKLDPDSGEFSPVGWALAFLSATDPRDDDEDEDEE